MNVSSTSYASSMVQQIQGMQGMQRKEPPSATELASQVFESSDTDTDGLLTLEELGIDEEIFASMDSDGDGSLNSSELANSISSQLQNMKDKTSSPQQFGEFLSSLGLEVPPPPQHGGMPNISNMASDIFNSSDADDDGLLSMEELGLDDQELFDSMDSDEDGMISQEELENKFASLFEELKNGDIEPSEFEQTMSALGAQTPSAPPGGGMMAGGGAGGGSSEEENYDAADSNQDGTVSAAEWAAYYGTSESSQNDMEKYTMDLVSTLIDALKQESTNDDNLELSQFTDIMKMVNNQFNDSNLAKQLNTYLDNLAS